jgi:hypothetical protein
MYCYRLDAAKAEKVHEKSQNTAALCIRRWNRTFYSRPPKVFCNASKKRTVRGSWRRKTGPFLATTGTDHLPAR